MKRRQDQVQEEIDSLRAENIVLRDAVENLASRLCEAKGRNPKTLCRGMPSWTLVLPERVRPVFKKGSHR